MEIVRGYRNVPASWPASAVAIGNFDGVHLGHHGLLEGARAHASRFPGAQAAVLTFDPHPSVVFAQNPPQPMLSSLERKLELLAEAGIEAVVVEPFTRELANAAPDAFVDDVVIGALHARAIVIGYDFNYGKSRAGTIETLRAHGLREHIVVDVVPAIEIAGEVASSTKIRNHLRAGDLASAELLLGRHWDVDGTVVHGAERGRTLGFPTANIKPESDLPVRAGIYAVTLTIDGVARPAVASLGTNPTFVDRGSLVLEVHVLDWSGDLYDRRVRTTFIARLRDEAKFASVDALVAQIHDDIRFARTKL